MEKVREINITPDKTLIKKLGLVGYRTEEAIAELIDNAMDARISSKTLLIEIILDHVGKKIIINDDGCGMDHSDLQNALIIAKEKKRSKKQLGQFGMGMKSACSTLGKKFSITTARPNSNKVLIAEYDEDEWLKDTKRSWSNFKIIEIDNAEKWHGTKIEITKINVSLYANQATNFKKNFGGRYAAYLRDGQSQIKVNQFYCKPIERPVLKNTVKKLNITLSSGKNICGWVGLVPHRTSKGEYGFHLYKNDRLIQTNAKLSLPTHPEVSRIVGELHFDPIPVNFHKTKFLDDSELYVEAKSLLEKNKILTELLSKERYATQNRTASVNLVYDYLKGDKPKKILPLKTQLSAINSKKILESADDLEFTENSKKVFLNYIKSDKLNFYDIKKSSGRLEISINKSCPAFSVLKNPLFLVGLVQIESKLLTEKLSIDEFLKKRNQQWSQFVGDFLSKESKKPTIPKERPSIDEDALYGLADELIDLHDYLYEKYEHRFQFTALSTLYAYLEYGLRTMLYTIYAERKTGQLLLDYIQQNYKNTGKFALLLNPSKIDIEKAFNVSAERPFLIIREYQAGELPKTVADPAKAWMDFYREIKSYNLPITDDELVTVLDALYGHNLIKKDKLENLAKHRNNLQDVQKYTEQIFGSSNH